MGSTAGHGSQKRDDEGGLRDGFGVHIMYLVFDSSTSSKNDSLSLRYRSSGEGGNG
jgi:hypothetical protein